MRSATECPAPRDADKRTLQLQERSNIPLNYQYSAFDNFKLPAGNPTARNGLSMVINTVRSNAREFPAGDPGTGKSHLAVAALLALIDYQNLFEQIKEGYDPSSGSSNREAYRSALDTEILILDDLAAGRLVVERGVAGKPEYRTTLSERIGSRARSRLVEMCRVIKMPQVEDFRLRRR